MTLPNRLLFRPHMIPEGDGNPERRTTYRVRTTDARGVGSQVYDRDFKFAAYSALGVRDVWRVDLQDRSVVVKAGGDNEQSQQQRFDWHPAEIEHPLTTYDPCSMGFKGTTEPVSIVSQPSLHLSEPVQHHHHLPPPRRPITHRELAWCVAGGRECGRSS